MGPSRRQEPAADWTRLHSGRVGLGRPWLALTLALAQALSVTHLVGPLSTTSSQP